MELKQEKGRFRVHIKLLENLIEYKVKRPEEEVEAYIPYEQVANDRLKFEAGNRPAGVVGGILRS